MTLHDDDILIAKIEKNSSEEVRVMLRRWKDRWNIDVRVYFPAKNGQMTPSKSGISLSVEKLPELADGIATALERAREQGWVK